MMYLEALPSFVYWDGRWAALRGARDGGRARQLQQASFCVESRRESRAPHALLSAVRAYQFPTHPRSPSAILRHRGPSAPGRAP